VIRVGEIYRSPSSVSPPKVTFSLAELRRAKTRLGDNVEMCVCVCVCVCVCAGVVVVVVSIHIHEIADLRRT